MVSKRSGMRSGSSARASSRLTSVTGNPQPSRARLRARERAALALQRWLGWCSALVWLPAATVVMRFGLRWRIEGMEEARQYYRALRACTHRPLLVCPNHLTMADSALVAWALGSPWWYLRHFSALPWNAPPRRSLDAAPGARELVYLMKCLSRRRGGDLRAAAAGLDRLAHLLARGEVALVFPEGGPSTDRVDLDRAAHGVGRLVSTLPGCRVLCVYLRGERQQGHSDLPARGDRLWVSLSTLEPKSDHAGLRGSRDVARQIALRLAEMERAHFERLGLPLPAPLPEAAT
jgi:hypothetical protein